MIVGVKKLVGDAKLPEYATPGAACFDIPSIRDAVVAPGGATQIGTGLAFEVPEGHVMLVFSRSGHGFKMGVRLSNCVGVIDSDYRGELAVKLKNDGCVALPVYQGDRIAQGMVLPVEQAQFVLKDELSCTERGEGGFGSTGVR